MANFIFWLEIAAKGAVILTLVTLIWYAWETRRMATATAVMARTQAKELEHLRWPVVIFGCANTKLFHFMTSIKNISIVSAKARVKATIVIDDRIMVLQPDNHYAGNRVWQIPAAGQEGSTFVGHLDFVNVFANNGVNDIDYDKVRAQVTIEAWVINFRDDEESLSDDANKVPVARFDWNGAHRLWIPEISPK